MPDGALLVNVARGPVVDTDAVLADGRAAALRASTSPTPSRCPTATRSGTPPTCSSPRTSPAVRRAMLPRMPRSCATSSRRLVAGEPLANVVSS